GNRGTSRVAAVGETLDKRGAFLCELLSKSGQSVPWERNPAIRPFGSVGPPFLEERDAVIEDHEIRRRGDSHEGSLPNVGTKLRALRTYLSSIDKNVPREVRGRRRGRCHAARRPRCRTGSASSHEDHDRRPSHCFACMSNDLVFSGEHPP